MFWKLVLTFAVVLVVFGRTSALRNPMIRLLLPRSWAMALAALPDRRPPTRPGPRSPAAESPAPRPRLDRRARLVLFAVLLSGLAAWMATRAIIAIEADARPEIGPP